MITVVLEILACLIVAALIGALAGWFLHRLKAEPTRRTAERLMMSLEEAEGTLLDVKAESRIHAARAEKLETEIRSRAISAQALENELSSLRARLSIAEKALETSTRERDDTARELEEAQEQLDGASAQIEEARQKMAEQERAAEHLQQTVEELKETQAISVTALAEKAREIDMLHAQLAEESSRHHTGLMEKADELAAAQERRAELERELEESRSARAHAEEETEQYRTALEEREAPHEEVRDADQEGVPETVVSVGPQDEDNGAAAAGVQATSTEDDDDLKLIPGIGPKLEQLLHGLGVRSFRQVALWSDEDIDRIDTHLERFHGRIRREGWVEGARREFSKKYGKPPEEM